MALDTNLRTTISTKKKAQLFCVPEFLDILLETPLAPLGEELGTCKPSYGHSRIKCSAILAPGISEDRSWKSISFCLLSVLALHYILCRHTYATLKFKQFNLHPGCIHTPDQTDTGSAHLLLQSASNEMCQATVIICSATSSAYNNKYPLIGNITIRNARRRRAAEGKNVPLLFSQSLWSHDISTHFPTTCADLELRTRWMLKRAIFIIPGEICKTRESVFYSPLTERSIGSFPLPISPWLHTTKHPFWH